MLSCLESYWHCFVTHLVSYHSKYQFVLKLAFYTCRDEQVDTGSIKHGVIQRPLIDYSDLDGPLPNTHVSACVLMYFICPIFGRYLSTLWW